MKPQGEQSDNFHDYKGECLEILYKGKLLRILLFNNRYGKKSIISMH